MKSQFLFSRKNTSIFRLKKVPMILCITINLQFVYLPYFTYKTSDLFDLEFNGPVTTVKVMLSWPLYQATLSWTGCPSG